MAWTLDGAGAAKGTPVGVHSLGAQRYDRLQPNVWTLPNNSAETTVYQWEGVPVSPGTQMGMVTASTAARAGSNAAGSWILYVRYRTAAGAVSGWEQINHAIVHNLSDAYASFNLTLQSWITVPSGYAYVDVHVNGIAEATGAAWSLHSGRIRTDWVGV